MKENKFRAWNSKEKFMDSAWLIDWEHGIVCHGKHNQSELEDCTLMQYTGLKDKNSVEIYEGDIESDENSNLSVVCYLEKYGAYCFVPLELYVHEDYENRVTYSFGYDCYFHNAIPSKYATVIGNIYENPALLEESHNESK